MRKFKLLAALLATTGLLASCADVPDGGSAGGDGTVTMAQVVPTLGYLSLDAARAFDTFGQEGLDYKHVQLSGGDPAALAALESGDVDFAAVGSEAPLLALAQGGGDYQIVYALMGQMSLDLTVSNDFLEKAGVSASAPLEERLAALKGARFGVSALGGAQERASRWIAARGGLNPDTDIEILNAGPPPALLAGLEEGRIDAFMLTEPNGALAEDAGFGTVLIEPGSEIEELSDFYHLVLVTRKDYAAENPAQVEKVVAALNEANQMILDDPEKVAHELGASTYDQVPQDILTESVESLASGVDSGGEVSAEGLQQVIDFTSETGESVVADQLDVTEGKGEWWTDEFTSQ